MKKIFAIFGLALALSACGDNNTTENSGNMGDTSSMSPATESTDTGVGTNSAGMDTTGATGNTRSGIGSGEPTINTGTSGDTSKY